MLINSTGWLKTAPDIVLPQLYRLNLNTNPIGVFHLGVLIGILCFNTLPLPVHRGPEYLREVNVHISVVFFLQQSLHTKLENVL